MVGRKAPNPRRKNEEIPMLKATKITLAAALIAGSCGFAMAQGGGAGGAGGAGGGVGTKNEPARANDENPTGAANPKAGNPAAGNPTAPMAGAPTNSAPAGMSTTGTGQPGGPAATTPGTNSAAGAGKGTTGTGQQGGSGNR